MATYVDRVEKSVTHYEPGPLPEEVEDLGGYVVTELKRLGDIILNQAIFRLERTHIEPASTVLVVSFHELGTPCIPDSVLHLTTLG